MKAKIRALFKATKECRPGMGQKFLVQSVWDWECFDRDGKLKWTEHHKNVCTDEGLNKLLDVMFHGATQIDTWYVSLFENDYTPISGNTYAVPGFTECTAYDEATRPAFNEGAASGKSITNSSNRAEFTISSSKTIYGGALVGGGTDGSTKGDTAGGGTLYAAGKFSEAKPVVEDDVVRVTVTLTAADV